MILKAINAEIIELIEYSIPARAAASQKPSSADISETKSGIIDPLVSKRQKKSKVKKKQKLY